MRVSSIDAAPAEMVGEPRSLCALHQLLQPAEVFAVGLLCRSEIHRDSVLHDLVLIEYLIQNVQRPAAAHFGSDTRSIQGRAARSLYVFRIGREAQPRTPPPVEAAGEAHKDSVALRPSLLGQRRWTIHA